MAQQTLRSKPDRLAVEYVATTSLAPNPKNARRHNSKQIAKLISSIRNFGFNGPIVIDENGEILAGHARYEAALRLGLKQVPCVRLTHLSPDQKKAFAIADNKIGDLSSFDDEALRSLMKELALVEFDMELTGFDTAEIDLLFDDPTAKTSTDPADTFAMPDPNQMPVSRVGDLWLLDRHRLLCGSVLDSTDYERLLGEDRAQLIFTDPPYNVPILGHVSGLGRVRHREFLMASGEMSEGEYRAFVGATLKQLKNFSRDGSIHYVCIDWRHVRIVLEVGESTYAEVKNICVWNKTNAGMGSLYRSKHEFVVVFKNGTARHQNNVELGMNGRYRTNVWDYPGVNAFGATRDADLAAHPTVKPVALVADAIRDCSKRGAIVLDPFVGSGVTILAAERTGRRAAAIELEPIYVDTAIARWQRMTGKTAFLEAEQADFQSGANGSQPIRRRGQRRPGRGGLTMANKAGYASPPESARWRKGQSGNPSGKRKKPANFANDLMAELAEVIQLTEGGNVKRITKQRAVIKALTAAAIKGNTRAANLLINWCARVIEGDPEGQEWAELDAKDRKIVEDYLERQVQLRLAKQRGGE